MLLSLYSVPSFVAEDYVYPPVYLNYSLTCEILRTVCDKMLRANPLPVSKGLLVLHLPLLVLFHEVFVFVIRYPNSELVGREYSFALASRFCVGVWPAVEAQILDDVICGLVYCLLCIDEQRHKAEVFEVHPGFFLVQYVSVQSRIYTSFL